MRTTFEMEGKGIIKPYMVRAGTQIIETRYDHGAQHVHLVLRPAKAEAKVIAHWTHMPASHSENGPDSRDAT